AMQLVESGKLTLDEPVAKHFPEFANLQVLTGFDQRTGAPVLRQAGRPILLRHLLTHTSGFAYDTWNEKLLRYSKQAGRTNELAPLLFEPGAQWDYGTSTDWTGRLVEAVSGVSLEGYFQRRILQPLAMKDTSFILPPEKFGRLVSSYARQGDGSLKEERRTQPPMPKSFSGGGGLYSTAGDYVRFMQMILRLGVTAGGERILQEKTVRMMQSNQIGEVSAGKMKSFRRDRSSDVDFHPGHKDGFTYGFLINGAAYDGRRSAGSLAWAGLLNTFFWIDPSSSLCAVAMMQFLPFCDQDAIGMLGDFERAIYRAVRP
ncbi:MAG: serine hydrolase domain-containing protein, partial [Bryobacteraceae bacterium]